MNNFNILDLTIGANSFSKICIGNEGDYTLNQIPLFRIAYTDYTFENCGTATSTETLETEQISIYPIPVSNMLTISGMENITEISILPLLVKEYFMSKQWKIQLMYLL